MVKKDDTLLGYPGMSEEEAQAVLDERKRRAAWKKTPKISKAARFDAAGMGTVAASGIPVPSGGLKIAVIPDAQCRAGVPLNHLRWCGEYLKRKQPDVIVCIGDFWDMPSLNTHLSLTQRAMYGNSYIKDIDAGKYGMDLLMNPIQSVPGWSPYKIFTMGNHCYRTIRAAEEDPRLQGLISPDHFELESWGWKVYPFLEPVEIGGVAFSHFFPSGVMGRPITSAAELLRKLHMSAFAGHQQGRDIAYSRRADGSNMTAIISGSFYLHDEDYLSPFTNRHWRGMYMLHEVEGGSFDEMAVSTRFLQRKFEERR